MNWHPDATDQDRDPLAVENAIFEAALQVSDRRQRAEFLDRVFRGDPAGRQAMEDLLGMAGSSAAFFLEGKLRTAELAREVIDEAPDDWQSQPDPVAAKGEQVGETIGRYRLVRKIGEGGCGEIFEAHQSGMVRPVALKIIRRGMDTESVVSRFEAERHALELMEHPNIARVIDAGRTPRGRPYFAMELVRGTKITSFCDAQGLGIRDRIELFLKVCQAIQHAHQKGIVHRDIKPSNILVENVDGASVPKVIDFGIAKAMEGGLRVRKEITVFDQFLGTPAYMSPEQIDMGGMDVDTRADIYSLGALLYELLAGCPPFDTDELLEAGITEMRRVLIEENPPLPSERVTAGEGPRWQGVTPSAREKWANQIRRELDWIVFKSMEKERNRRYLTVNSLTMDLRRFLNNEPVIARKPSRRYLMRKFFQRNRIACLLSGAVLVSLIAGFGTTTVLYLREREAMAEQARLKRKTQARANVSRAAILLSEGSVEEADRLLRTNPLETIDASPEAAEVFRALGRWNAIFSRWQQAAHCFHLMNDANRLGDKVRMAEEVDLLMAAPAYLEAGDRDAYREFRADVLERFVPAQNSLQAEHLLKVCLLLPADDEIIRRLESTVDACRAGHPTRSGIHGFPDWNALSLSLFYLRKSDLSRAVREAETCLSYPDRAGSRVAAARCVLAMSYYRMGLPDQAHQHLDEARSDLHWVESQIDESGFPPIGTWFAWSVVRILVREAEGMMGM
ncbi:hypothetical protein HNR46_003867 [Haloferula luteola]|uniref:Protein kinase domain-containing protein n=1 Tax=Haloferula luteola TaxID=595692 RepID=A0A840V962_9BACT|nr:serine/threonine-protein kinase [Haloferula luteola]MBB5353606.1 hypothetical protein [Haloferula luteola]